MKIGATEASPRAIQRAAEKKFKGGYYCCEALISAIREEFKLDVPEKNVIYRQLLRIPRRYRHGGEKSLY